MHIEETIKEKERVHQKQIGGLAKELGDERDKRKSAEKEAQGERARSRTFKRNLIKWSIFTVGLILISSGLWLTLFRLPLLGALKDKTIIGIVSQLALIFAFLNIPLKQHWKIWLPLMIVSCVALLPFLRTQVK